MTADSWPEDGDGDQANYDAYDDTSLDDDTLDLGHNDDFGDDEDLTVDSESPDDAPDDGDGPDVDLVIDDDVTVDTTDEEVVGSDPDAVDTADSEAFDPQFPPELSLDPMPEPVDGQPWSDADLLGDTSDTVQWNNLSYTPVTEDLLAMDASDGGWDALLGSTDPAVASLARWWQS
ncbi:hypothetical protein ACFQ3B_20250 [Stackebrandtia endophytica]|uniref:hypothetical protein n=1 Tax=Stackebrandtia endophytica TaxID=1496996 RepID=UPI001153236F|nr:hypothetical protein [Stackebrandtia endophytica]